MRTAATPAAVASWIKGWRRISLSSSAPLVLVPTMGALHGGHEALIRKARRLAGASGGVAVSAFVNPIQFAPGEDFDRYPRRMAEDSLLCRRAGVDLLFRPSVSSMYASDASVTISEKRLSSGLCGASRPGHFDGVCTVVAMLFNIVRPDIAVFGEKDWQQLAILRRMVRDLKFPVRVIGHPVVREEDGLAMSSRNAMLPPRERSLAPRIYQALLATAMECEGRGHSVTALIRRLKADLRAIPGAVLDYAEIVEADTLLPIARSAHSSGKKRRSDDGNAPGKIKGRILVAVTLGGVRLIDNVPIPLA